MLITPTVIISCTCGVDKDALTIKDKYIFNNDFRMDGYYRLEGDTINYFRYFFQNGSCFSASGGNFMNNQYPALSNNIRNAPFFWGYFTVEKDELDINRMPLPEEV